MNNLKKLVTEIYNIIEEDLDANYRVTDHIDYIMDRINGRADNLSEEEWFYKQCN